LNPDTLRDTLVLDTSAVLAFLNRADPDHVAVRAVLQDPKVALIVPVGIMAEIGYLVETRLGQDVLGLFLQDILSENFTLDCGAEDTSRVRDLVARYRDMRLGYADAVVIACAERSSRKIVSLDRRHLDVVRREIAFDLMP
jgi:uncharacterized protein